MIVKEYHINKNRVHDIWNDCERFQQNGNHFFEELKKVQSISSVPPSENIPQENNHPISGSLDGPFALAPSARTDPFHESIEINAQEKQKKKKKLPKRSLQDQPKSIRSSDLPEISARVFIKTPP
ncbi:5213_t:CDS:1 [Funneliformis geosporum]|nr:5213_t:CDS:1 [Funneliformis geosporum]